MKFKKFAIGLAILVLTIVFIVFANKAINQEPKDNCYGKYVTPNYNSNGSSYYDNYDSLTGTGSSYDVCNKKYDQDLKSYNEKSFVTVMIMSLLAIIAGVLVRSVAPVSWGLLLAGVSTMLYIFTANFEDIGKPYRAIVSGLALAILIWIAYAKLGDKERLEGEKKVENTSPPPPVAPIS